MNMADLLAQSTGSTIGASLPSGSSDGGPIKIPLVDIFDNPNQPRKFIDNDFINELKDSISEHGLIQPIVVRRLNSGYELMAGQQRLKAVKLLGRKEIDAIVKDVDDNTAQMMSLIENIQRKDLNIFDEAKAVESLMIKSGLSQANLAKALGKNKVFIWRALELLKMPELLMNAWEEGKVSSGRALIELNNALGKDFDKTTSFIANSNEISFSQAKQFIDSLSEDADIADSNNVFTIENQSSEQSSSEVFDSTFDSTPDGDGESEIYNEEEELAQEEKVNYKEESGPSEIRDQTINENSSVFDNDIHAVEVVKNLLQNLNGENVTDIARTIVDQLKRILQ